MSGSGRSEDTAPPSTEESGGPTRCANCSTPLSGAFCAQCGQAAADPNVPIGRFAREFVAETLDIDSRLRVTLWPLFFKPGAVPRDYVAGQRAQFVPPIRLYVFASFFVFLVLSFGPSTFAFQESGPGSGVEVGAVQEPETSPTVTPGQDSEQDSGGVVERLAQGLQRASSDREGFTDAFTDRMAQAMFLLLPAFALLLKVAYRRRLYIQHLVFAIYFHSFVFILLGFVALPAALGLQSASDVAGIALLGVPVHLFVGMRRFYGLSRVRTFGRFALVSVTYLVLGVATMFALLVVSLMMF